MLLPRPFQRRIVNLCPRCATQDSRPFRASLLWRPLFNRAWPTPPHSSGSSVPFDLTPNRTLTPGVRALSILTACLNATFFSRTIPRYDSYVDVPVSAAALLQLGLVVMKILRGLSLCSPPSMISCWPHPALVSTQQSPSALSSPLRS